jgi:DNA-binding CsgD family transcriptional regulator
MKATVEYETGDIEPIKFFDDPSYLAGSDRGYGGLVGFEPEVTFQPGWVTIYAAKAIERASMTDDVFAAAQVLLKTIEQRHVKQPHRVDLSDRINGILGLATDDRRLVQKRFDALAKRGRARTSSIVVTSRLLGRMAAYLGQDERAQAYFEEALRFSGAVGYRPEYVLTCYYYSKMMRDRGTPADQRRTEELVSAGLRVAKSIGMKQLVELLRLWVPSDHSRDAVGAIAGKTLTQRQLDVLGLVAAGLSNQEIGDRLAISVHTVARHIANIYENVDATNRVELATYAIQIGLDPNSSARSNGV